MGNPYSCSLHGWFRTTRRIHAGVVGVAGENHVTYASLTADYFSSASRCGLGTILGQKQIKAIAVHGGRGHIKVADVPAADARALHVIHKHRSARPFFGSESLDRSPRSVEGVGCHTRTSVAVVPP